MTAPDEHAASVDVDDDFMNIVETAGAGSSIPEFDAEQERHSYREMLLIRRFEDKAGHVYGMGFIGGFSIFILGRKPSSYGCRCASTTAIRYHRL